jgi:uncharacterized protein (TIGR02996 family)
MLDRDALFAAIAAQPGEDAPRLALADYFIENGPTEADRARGEFIRLSFERPRLPENSSARAAADTRYQELHQKYGATWFAPLPRYTRHYWVERGFVEGVQISGQQLTQWDRHARWCPTIRALQLRNCRGRLAILAWPLTAKLTELDVGGFDPNDLKAVAESPYLANLKVLKLHWADVADVVALLRSQTLPIARVVLGWYANNYPGSIAPTAGATLWVTSFSMRWQWDHLPRLWACPEWAKVRELWLPWRQSQNQGIAEPLGEILERAPHLTGVRELSLVGNALDDNQIQALTRCPSLGNLEVLTLTHNRIGDAGAEALVTRWPNLTDLDLAQNAIGSRGARTIAERTTRLEKLNLETNNIFLPGMAALALAPRLANLTALRLKGNPGESLGASVLASSPHLKPGAVEIGTGTSIQSDAVLKELEELPEASAIRKLSLAGGGITDKGLKSIARNEHLTGVTELGMSFCHISKVGLNALAKWAGLRALRTFGFMTSVNNLCCHGKDFDELFRSPHWGAFEHLNMTAGHRLGGDGLAALAASKFAPTLRELSLGYHGVTDRGAEALAAGDFRALRKLELGWDGTITTKGIVAIAAVDWPSLEELGAWKLTDEGLKALAASAGFARLTKFTAGGDELTPEGIRALVASARFLQLTALELSGRQLTDDAARALVEAPTRPTGLTHLNLSNTALTAGGVALLANSGLLAGVHELHLRQLNLGPELGRALAEGRRLASVTTLALHGNRLGDDGLLALARSDGLPNLKKLLIGAADCTDACFDELAAAPLVKRLEVLSLSFSGRDARRLRELCKERLGEKVSV